MDATVPNLTQYVAPAMVVGARVAGWMSFTPFLGHAALPPQVKVALTIALTILLYPMAAANMPGMTEYPGPAVLVGEMSVGMVIGLCLQFVFDGIATGGQVVGTQLGFSMANLIDPMSQVETTVISVFHQSVALLIFLQMNVHHALLRALGRSFRYVPAGTAFQQIPPAPQIVHMASGIFLVAIEIAAPVMLATMLTDVALAFLSRTSPQLNVMLVGIAVKSLLGYAILGATVGLWPVLFERHFLAALNAGERLLSGR